MGKKKNFICRVDECAKKAVALQLCPMHHRRYKLYGDPLKKLREYSNDEKLCSINKCYNKHYCKSYCLKHYQQYKRTGNPIPSYIYAPWGGGHISKDGYRMLTINGRRQGEHRHVMEGQLQRPLRKEEEVHHINGDKLDNRIHNLELWSKSHPAGQRVIDKIRWAKEMLALYEPSSLKDFLTMKS